MVTILPAGLPNLTGELQVDRMGLLTTNPGQAYTRGVFSVGSTQHLSNGIYGASTTVQQAALQLIAQIKY